MTEHIVRGDCRPALQNIPIRTELGKELRRQFLTEDKLKGVDYSKIEMELAEQLKKEKS
jgi:DNA polymerase I-like protein with 3'-5' exonuclease and polymerase domains